jgi:hypothetical protein
MCNAVTNFFLPDSTSSTVEAIFSDLEENPEDSGILASVKPCEAALLARLIQERIVQNPDRSGQEIEQELTVGMRLVNPGILF